MKKKLITLVKVYLFAWFLMTVFIIWQLLRSGSDISQAFEVFFRILGFGNFQLTFHFLFLIFYLLFLVLRYFYRLYRKRGVAVALKGFFLKFILPLALVFGSLRFIIYQNSREAFDYKWNTAIENTTGFSRDLFAQDGKHRGMTVFGWKKENKDAIASLNRNNIEWVAVVPYFYQENENSSQIRLPENIGSWSRRDSTFINAIDQLHQKGIYVHLKPHLWLGKGWRSNLRMANSKDWDNWFASYEKIMLHYATMAEQTGAELLCIGTELRTSVKTQPEKWRELIKKIRAVYSGKLTYAANWDGEFDDIKFWDQLDYIGLQAYFPLTKKRHPQLSDITKGWQRHTALMKKLHTTYNKPVLFTEIGYKSEATATIRPWEWNSFLNSFTGKKSDKTQHLAYEAMFESFWNEDWFAGAYFWQWDTRTRAENATYNLDFSPRFKAAENTMAKWFARLSEKAVNLSSP
ncbi:hypothetical protein GWK08_11815 [Leptobacterium flavescens]|uniref:Glycoside hydrolase n=1 Tax=Leptobacterium flavescens TaxID=472055 RepID=A0A6P0UL93_9FLAO|nr:hypothetical protein [Leptobacterium flavescens]NER14131.1 hypothetical protein [Leptobacterium flavescens]